MDRRAAFNRRTAGSNPVVPYMHTKDKGDMAETQVLAELKRIECGVSLPFGDNLPYDMIVDSGGQLYKVQVKHSRYENGCVTFQTRSSNYNTNEVWHETYDGKIDYFAVFSPETGNCYAIPIEEAGSSSMRLRVEEPDNPSPNVNWASDYLLTRSTF